MGGNMPDNDMVSRTIHNDRLLSMLRYNTLHYDVGTVAYPDSLPIGSSAIDDGLTFMLCHNRNGRIRGAIDFIHNQAFGIKAITEYKRLTGRKIAYLILQVISG